MPSTDGFVEAGGHRLESVVIAAHQVQRPSLVFLHEGLGSISLWRDFPQRVAQAAGCRTLVYSRYGYGASDVMAEPRQPDYMHREALAVLPELLAHFGIERPVLVGHSDGASIALIHAGRHPCAGVVVLAPHLFVEEMAVQGIEATVKAFETTPLADRLARHHRDARRTFYGWADIWRRKDFRAWNIEDTLPGIACPILAIQGEDDEYATMAQLESIAARAAKAPAVELLKLADCRHSPHRDQPEAVQNAIVRFVDGLPCAARPGPHAC